MDAVLLLDRVCSLLKLSCRNLIQMIHNNMNNERILVSLVHFANFVRE